LICLKEIIEFIAISSYRKFLTFFFPLREGAEWVVREGLGAGGRNDPSLVCTYE
jgi:hypothetical protein